MTLLRVQKKKIDWSIGVFSDGALVDGCALRARTRASQWKRRRSRVVQLPRSPPPESSCVRAGCAFRRLPLHRASRSAVEG